MVVERWRAPPCLPLPGAVAWGDDAWGLWLDVGIAVPGGAPVVQRLRWIEPGTFRMGSPASEPDRSEDEGPRHTVTLTRGYWLADTACTQALWQAVMGDNPSHFRDNPALPVESVSWEAVQGFLSRLQERLPGVAAELPTEAEWEYACRAGTETPFSFGVQVTPAEVNYDGNHPYAGGEKGEYRQRTLAVKSLPANAWGLYEMHGNAWEWCADGTRRYTAEPQQDPRGPDGGRRALRGGSWFFVARDARSAYRYAFVSGFAFHFLGFRFCLRSSEPGTGVLPGRQDPAARGVRR